MSSSALFKIPNTGLRPFLNKKSLADLFIDLDVVTGTRHISVMRGETFTFVLSLHIFEFFFVFVFFSFAYIAVLLPPSGLSFSYFHVQISFCSSIYDGYIDNGMVSDTFAVSNFAWSARLTIGRCGSSPFDPSPLTSLDTSTLFDLYLNSVLTTLRTCYICSTDCKIRTPPEW